MPIGEAAAVVSTLKNAYDLVERLKGNDDREALRNGIAALTDMLITARGSALLLIEEKATLVDRVQILERDIRHLVDFDERSEKYERVQTRNGQFVYRERVPPGGNAGAPYFCPTCFANKRAEILTPRNDGYHLCHTCNWGNFL